MVMLSAIHFEFSLTWNICESGGDAKAMKTKNTHDADAKNALLVLLLERLCNTHNPPTAKISTSHIFCLIGMLSDQIVGIGRRRIAISVTMLSIALKSHEDCVSMKCPPLIERSKKKGTGVHMKIEVNNVVMPYARTIPIMAQHIIR